MSKSSRNFGYLAKVNPTLKLINGKAICTSLQIAAHFERRHTHVLRDIETLLQQLPKINQPSFGLVEYFDGKGESRPMYQLDRDAFTLLAMSFKGKRALQFKLAYLDAFNAMERQLRQQAANPLDAIANLQAELMRARPEWQTIVRCRWAGLSYPQIAKVLGCGTATVERRLRKMRELGLLPHADELPQLQDLYPQLLGGSC